MCDEMFDDDDNDDEEFYCRICGANLDENDGPDCCDECQYIIANRHLAVNYDTWLHFN